MKKFLFTTAFSLLGALLLVGCSAKVGQDFKKPSDGALVLGQTTYTQSVNQLGKPYKEAIKTINDHQINEATYMYVDTAGDGVESRVVPAKILTLSFTNNKLVGQVFLSSFKIDNSDFDNSKVATIKKGETTYSEVIAILGNPTGRKIVPLVASPSVKAITYAFSMTKTRIIGNGTDSFTKTVEVEFDDKNIVSKIFANSK